MSRKPGSISGRAFRTVLLGLLTSLLVILVFAWWSLEDLEGTMLEADHFIELEHFEKYGDKAQYRKIQTGQMVSVFRPHPVADVTELPIVFQGLPVPYQGMVDSLGTEYAVITHAFPEGDFYLAKNLQLFEEREEQLNLYIQLLAAGIFVVGLLIARFTSRTLSRPIVRLATDIHELRDGGMEGRLDDCYPDRELNEIAGAINANLKQVEASFKRERSLISMASHELRTPVSVVLGAAAIMEKRGNLEAEDAITLQRIKQAAQDMSANIQASLEMVRRTKQVKSEELLDLAGLLREIREDYELEGLFDLDRLVLAEVDGDVQVRADKVLVRMVLHNIISNALNHTRGQVSVSVYPGHVEIADAGSGPRIDDVPEHDSAALEAQPAGMGLYIVNLACERLGWLYESEVQAEGGVTRLWFKPLAADTTAGSGDAHV